jgi:hypothetical protein
MITYIISTYCGLIKIGKCKGRLDKRLAHYKGGNTMTKILYKSSNDRESALKYALEKSVKFQQMRDLGIEWYNHVGEDLDDDIKCIVKWLNMSI